MKFLKEKAAFLIFLIVASGFSLINLPEKVEAQQKGCCERTKSGEFCQYTDLTECEGTPFLSTPALCEQSSFCRLGCCFDSDSGDCFKHTSKAECQRKEGTWEESELCEIQQCEVGCCKISNQAFISTLTRCKQITSEHEHVETIFDTSIQDEFTCANSVRTGDLGCCVRAEGDCSFGTRADCGLEASQPELDEEGNPIAGTQATEGAFHLGVLCSNDVLKCNAAKQQKLGCYNEDVYWFDSEGNPENVFLGESSEAKASSYNNGRVLEEAGCVATPGDKNCGNCDYTEGTLCAERDGEVSCIDLNCRDTTENDFGPDATGGAKEHGESWCLYDGPVGFGNDRVGSRHFKAVCLNGEESIEPCRDYREEYCTQSYSNGQATTDYGSINLLLTENIPQLIGYSSPLYNLFMHVGSGYSEAACRENRFDSCAQCNEFESTSDARECCEEAAYRDCYFKPTGVTTRGGTCVPLVPPGLRFWGEETSVLDRAQAGTDEQGQTIDRTPSAPGDDVCSAANIDCEVGFTRSGWDHILGRSKWECTYNCRCITEDFFAAAHSVCRSLGDCGSYFNWIGRFTDGGIDVKVNGPEGETAIPDKLREKVKLRIKDDLLRDALVKPPKEEGSPDKPGFGDFFKRSAVPIGLILTSGVMAAGTPVSFFGGLLYGPQFLAGSVQSLLTGVFAKVGAGGAVGGTPEIFLGTDAMAQTASAAEAAAKKATEEAAKKAGEEATKETAKASASATTSGMIWGTVQVIAWGWMIYEAIDVFAADTMTASGTFLCKSWEAPDGGRDCGKCNEGALPCSEYRCKALGKACSLINEGEEGRELCVNMLPGDASSPVIDADRDAMGELVIDAKSNGFTVTERIPPFTPVHLAITTDEPAQCKFSNEPDVDFEEMTFDFGDPLFDFEHNLTFSLPSELATDQAIELTNGGQYTLYVRCKDAVGNPNRRDYFIKFGIQKGPDLTAPQIVDTSIENGAFIASNVGAVELDIFVNEPAHCKWDRRDIDYNEMQNEFSCAPGGFDMTFSGTYRCNDELSLEAPEEGLDGESNNESEGTSYGGTKQNTFYFRCRDNSERKNTNMQSSRFTLVSTLSLEIESAEPSGLLRTGTDIELKVKTIGGAENGIATCGYSQEDIMIANMPEFSSTNSNVHTQPLPPQPEGAYTFYVGCVDKAGNIGAEIIEFTVEKDVKAPELVFVFKDTQLGVLTIKTSEPASCEYAENDFLFGRGTPMASSDNIEHEASLGQDVYVIKCQDLSEEHNEATFKVVP